MDGARLKSDASHSCRMACALSTSRSDVQLPGAPSRSDVAALRMGSALPHQRDSEHRRVACLSTITFSPWPFCSYHSCSSVCALYTTRSSVQQPSALRARPSPRSVWALHQAGASAQRHRREAPLATSEPGGRGKPAQGAAQASWLLWLILDAQSLVSHGGMGLTCVL